MKTSLRTSLLLATFAFALAPLPAMASEDAGTAVVAPIAAPLSGDEARVVEFTRRLETAPFDADARSMRAWLIEWITEAPDVSVVVCDTLGLFDDEEHPHEAELAVQSMFGIATWLLEHKGQDDTMAAQRAGIVSSLRAYASMLRDKPEARIAHFDAMLAKLEAGELDAHVAPVIERECMAPAKP